MDINQETAKKLLADGGTFIFLGVPEGTEFGIDMKSWNTGENFRGVKMIPPGMHFIFYSSVGIMGETAPRSGFFYNFRKSEVLIKKWDVEKEDISDEEVDSEEITRMKDNIMALDKFLGPYPYDIFEKWRNLSLHVTDSLVKKLSPACGRVKSALELMSCKDEDRPRNSDQGPSTSKPSKRTRLSTSEDIEAELLPHLVPIEGTALQLTKLPDKNYPEDATAAQITQHCMDLSYTLDIMIKNYINPIDMIGEVEFAYICFLVGHSLEAFEHWKKLVDLLCSCDSAIRKYRAVYDNLISLLEVQIKEIPEDFLADIVTNNNFIYIKLRNLFRAIIESEIDGRLKSKAERFKDNLTHTYLWDFTHLFSEDEEDAPVVVRIKS